MKINPQETISFVNQFWDESIIPALSEYIRIPCRSTLYDLEWEKNNYLKTAAEHIVHWAQQQNIVGLKAEVIKLNNFAPLIFIEVDASTESNKTVLLYSHYDKMPESSGWDEGLGAWTPVLKNDKLYGRGAVDDGYAVFTYIAAIKALQTQKIPHAKFVFLIEGAEESGSGGFAEYMHHLRDRIGEPGFVVFLDGECKDYKRLWATTSTRGLINGFLNIEILTLAEHSGCASGIVPSTFRILRQVLSRIEDQETGKILLKTAQLEIPQHIFEAAKHTANILGDEIYTAFHLVEGARPADNDVVQLILNNTWRSTLCIIGAEGFPELKDASNALRPYTKVKLSLRIPPLVNSVKVGEELKAVLEKNPPYGARINFSFEFPPEDAWEATGVSGTWLSKAFDEASEIFCNEKAATVGAGGSIGTLPIISNVFPKSVFLLPGCAGPGSGSHGINEFLHIPFAKKMTCGLAYVFAEFYATDST